MGCDGETYKQEFPRIEDEVLTATIAAHEPEWDETELSGVLGYAERVIASPARTWSEFTLDQRQRFQVILFPEGLTWGDNGFQLEPVHIAYFQVDRVDFGPE